MANCNMASTGERESWKRKFVVFIKDRGMGNMSKYKLIIYPKQFEMFKNKTLILRFEHVFIIFC